MRPGRRCRGLRKALGPHAPTSAVANYPPGLGLRRVKGAAIVATGARPAGEGVWERNSSHLSTQTIAPDDPGASSLPGRRDRRARQLDEAESSSVARAVRPAGGTGWQGQDLRFSKIAFLRTGGKRTAPLFSRSEVLRPSRGQARKWLRIEEPKTLAQLVKHEITDDRKAFVADFTTTLRPALTPSPQHPSFGEHQEIPEDAGAKP